MVPSVFTSVIPHNRVESSSSSPSWTALVRSMFDVGDVWPESCEVVTAHEIEERWLGGFAVDVDIGKLVDSFNRVEDAFGRSWLERSIASSVVGPAVTLPLHVLQDAVNSGERGLGTHGVRTGCYKRLVTSVARRHGDDANVRVDGAEPPNKLVTLSVIEIVVDEHDVEP